MVRKLTLLELNVDVPEFGTPGSSGRPADETESDGTGVRSPLGPLVGMAFLAVIAYVARRAIRSRRTPDDGGDYDAETESVGDESDRVDIAGR